MKQFLTTFLTLLPVVLAISCSLEEEFPADDKMSERSIRISVASAGTKTVLGEESDGKIPVYWSEGDRIAVNGVSSSPLGEASMASVADFKVRNVSPPYHVIYPASAYAGEEGDSKVKLDIPVSQDYVPGSFGSGADILYGVSDTDDAVTVSHLCGTIRVSLTDEQAAVIRSLTLRSISETAPIAGDFILDLAAGSLSAYGNTSCEVSLGIPEEGVALGDMEKDFFFYEWVPEKDGKIVIRLVTSWGTTEEDVDAFLKAL